MFSTITTMLNDNKNVANFLEGTKQTSKHFAILNWTGIFGKSFND